MTWTNIKWIYLREIRDQLRDRRTLFTIFVLPMLLYPLLGMGFLQIAQFRRETPTPILVVGAQSLPTSSPLISAGKFAAAFCTAAESQMLPLEMRPEQGALDESQLRQIADESLRSGKYYAVVFFPPGLAARLTQTDPVDKSAPSQTEPAPLPQPAIFLNSASDKSRIAGGRVERVLSRWRQSIVRDNLKRNHLPAEAVEPFQVVNTDVSREHSRRAAVWSKILPFVVLIWALTGAFYPAIDLCAGEKERGTLETLLCSPARRVEIVWGKLLTVMTFSMATSILNLLSLGTTGTFVMHQIQRLGGDAGTMALGPPPWSAIAWLLLALFPLSALFSALSLAIAAFARSSKEGQYYLMPLLLITLPLMMLPMLPNSQLELGTSFLPVAGVMLLLRSLIEGQYWEALRFVVPVTVVTALGCGLAIRWAVDQFNNESVLFREGERWSVRLWLQQLVRDRGPTPSVTTAVLCGVLLLVIRFFSSFLMSVPENWSGFAMTAVLSLVGFFAVPALIMTFLLTRDPRRTLSLYWPGLKPLGMAVLLALVIHPSGLALAQAVKAVYPFSEETLAQVRSLGVLFSRAPSVGMLLLVMAVTPAICEELAFRGFILSGMRHSGHKLGAILGSAFFFGAAHGILQQSISAAVLGVVLGYLAIQTGSILTTISFHLLYNAASMLMLAWSSILVERVDPFHLIFRISDDGLEYQPWMVGLSILAAGACLLWFRKLPCQFTTEERLQSLLNQEWEPERCARSAPFQASLSAGHEPT